MALGLASLALAQQPLKPPIYDLASSPTLRVGETQAGELTRDDARDFINGGYLDLWAIPSDGNEVLELRLSGRGFTPFGSTFSPAGEPLEAESFTRFTADQDITTVRATINEAGVYLLVVSGYGPDSLGRYELTRAIAVVGEGSTYDVAPPVMIAASLGPLATDLVRFDLSEPAVVRVALATADWLAQITLRSTSPDYLIDTANTLWGSEALMGPLLEPGSYELSIEGVGGESGDYTLVVDALMVADAERLGDEIASPVRLEGEPLLPGGTVRYPLRLDARARVSIALESYDFDTFLEVFDEATGELLGANDDDEYTSNSFLELELDAGRYLVVVRSFFSSDSGIYSLSLDW